MLTRILIALCVAMGVGALASAWRGKPLGWWTLAGGVGAFFYPAVTFGVAFVVLAMLGPKAEAGDSGLSLPNFSSGDD